MKRILALALAGGFMAMPALAALNPGDKAPDFTAPATLGGKEFTFSLADALKQGPVVLYFYPKAFTSGCSVEAHNFAEATERYKALGARVIGVSHDPIATLDKFSVADCASKFALASDEDLKIAASYDAVMIKMVGLADRTSYVIAPDGQVIYAYNAMDPDKHVENTLAALTKWRAEHKS